MASRDPRERKSVVLNPETAASELLKKGWGAFNADPSDIGDGKEDCEASLWYRQKDSGKSFHGVTGSTGKEHGHAEMDALHKLLEASDGTLDGKEVRVHCTAKPCCVRCAATLGLLGIQPWDSETKKAKKAMGSTEWGTSAKVRAYIAKSVGTTEAVIGKFGSCLPK